MQLILFFFIRRLSNETLISRSVHPLIHPRIYQIHMWKHSNIEQSVSLVFFRVFCCYCCVCVAYLTKKSFMLFVLFFCNRKSIGKRAKAIQWRFGPQSWAGTTISSNPRVYSGMLNITWTYSICDYFNSKCFIVHRSRIDPEFPSFAHKKCRRCALVCCERTQLAAPDRRWLIILFHNRCNHATNCCYSNW